MLPLNAGSEVGTYLGDTSDGSLTNSRMDIEELCKHQVKNMTYFLLLATFGYLREYKKCSIAMQPRLFVYPFKKSIVSSPAVHFPTINALLSHPPSYERLRVYFM